MGKNYEVMTDCFAYKNGHCSALNDLYCEKEDCRFYASKEEYLKKQLKLSEVKRDDN